MNQGIDASKAKIEELESNLRRWEIEYGALNNRLQKNEQHLQSVLAERDKAITDAAALRMDITDLQNVNIRLHAKNGDLERQLDTQVPTHHVTVLSLFIFSSHASRFLTVFLKDGAQSEILDDASDSILLVYIFRHLASLEALLKCF